MVDHAIITYLNSKYFNNFIRDFIPTLFEDAKYSGKLYVISYGLTDKEKRIICTMNDNILFFEGDNSSKRIEVQRNYDILKLMQTIEEEVIMTIDAGDVWFQSDFEEVFELCKNSIGVVAENEICTDAWMGQKINQLKDSDLKTEIIKKLTNKQLIGSGMICANKTLFIALLERVIEVTNELDDDYFGVDQIVMDFVLYNYCVYDTIFLPHTYDYVIFQRLNPFTIDSDKKFYQKSNNKLIKIVHNAGGESRAYPEGRKDMPNTKLHVLAAIPTKNRYFTTLPLTLSSLITQTVKPDKILIIDDSDNPIDLRRNPTYKHLFNMMESKGIRWEIVMGKKQGQHHSHELSQEHAIDLVYRIDDDTVIEPDVLEQLLKHFENNDKMGAVGGLILTAPLQVGSPSTTNKIENSLWELNSQLFITPNRKILDTDHLHCSFLYRAGIAHYDLNLSTVAHREETLFSYAIKQAGYDVKIDQSVITWHLRNPEGGIRTFTKAEFWHKDEAYYKKKLDEWNIDYTNTKVVYLTGGLGDIMIFKKIMPDYLEKYKDFNKIIVTINPELFDEYRHIDKLKIMTRNEGYVLVNNIENRNIYNYMLISKWEKDVESAYREYYKF